MITQEKKLKMEPQDLHYEILTNPKLTHSFLENAFKADGGPTPDEGFSIVGNPEFLKMLNIFQN